MPLLAGQLKYWGEEEDLSEKEFLKSYKITTSTSSCGFKNFVTAEGDSA